jgi:hypothetical protein
MVTIAWKSLFELTYGFLCWRCWAFETVGIQHEMCKEGNASHHKCYTPRITRIIAIFPTISYPQKHIPGPERTNLKFFHQIYVAFRLNEIENFQYCCSVNYNSHLRNVYKNTRALCAFMQFGDTLQGQNNSRGNVINY